MLSRDEKEDSGRESDESGRLGIFVGCFSRIDPIEFLLTRGEPSPVFLDGGVVFPAKLDDVSAAARLARRGAGVVVFFDSEDEVGDAKLGSLFSSFLTPPLILRPDLALCFVTPGPLVVELDGRDDVFVGLGIGKYDVFRLSVMKS